MQIENLSSCSISTQGSLVANEQACNKNREEYNLTADFYDQWQNNNLIMQEYCYYSELDQLEKLGISDKIFLEVGCGPCPIGQKLAQKGAKKIYGIDISQSMIDVSEQCLQKMGFIDKFELFCADIFDKNFILPEKVDCVVLSYTASTFVSNFETLKKLIIQCKEYIKEDGYVIVTDFSWVEAPKDNFWAGFYTESYDEKPKDFEKFKFIIETAPNQPYDIFNIPANIMFQAGMQAGFKSIDFKLQYSNPKFKDHSVIKRYIQECKSPEYVMIMK